MSFKRKMDTRGEKEEQEEGVKRQKQAQDEEYGYVSEELFSELYSKIEKTAGEMESSVTTREKKRQFEQDVEQYKKILEARYNEVIEDESEGGTFYYYNGCHGYLESDCEPYIDIPSSVEEYILDKKKSVTFIIHKKALVFSKVNVGNFTETASLAFRVDKDQYRRYLKLEYKLNEDKERGEEFNDGKVELTIYVYNNKSQPIQITKKEGIPNIRLEYHTKDFNMGYFPLLHGPTDSVFYVSEYKFTEGGFFQGSYVFPKLVADFEYTEKDKGNFFFNSSLFSSDESLLDRCFKGLYDYYEDKERGEEFNDGKVQEIEINIFNSSCLYSTNDVRIGINEKYKQWSRIMAHEIEIISEESPQKKARGNFYSGVKGHKKKKRKTKRKKTKGKTKRSSKKKRRTKKKKTKRK